MTHHDSMLLNKYQDVTDVLIQLAHGRSGWRLDIRHRHIDGRLGDCTFEVYEWLTLAEVLEVLDSVLVPIASRERVQPQ